MGELQNATISLVKACQKCGICPESNPWGIIFKNFTWSRGSLMLLVVATTHHTRERATDCISVVDEPSA